MATYCHGNLSPPEETEGWIILIMIALLEQLLPLSCPEYAACCLFPPLVFQTALLHPPGRSFADISQLIHEGHIRHPNFQILAIIGN